MDVRDYLIPQFDFDWSLALADWTPPLPEQFSLWLINRLGEIIAVSTTQSVVYLNIGTGTCETIAPSREAFASMLEDPRNADRFLRIQLTDACRRAGLTLAKGQCYGFKVPPTLGGEYRVENLQPTHLAMHYSYQAYICRQNAIYWIPPAI